MEKFKLFNLQLFAEDGAGATGGTEPGTAGATGTEGGTGTEPGKKEPEKKYSDDDIDRIIGQKFAEWQKKQEKKVSEAERLARMSEEEKAAENLKALEKRIADYEKREARSEMTKQARAILMNENIHVDDTLVANLIAEDAETTKASVESFVKLFKGAVESAVKERLKSEPPKKGSGASGLTKEQIMAVTNRAERQRLINENINLFQ